MPNKHIFLLVSIIILCLALDETTHHPSFAYLKQLYASNLGLDGTRMFLYQNFNSSSWYLEYRGSVFGLPFYGIATKYVNFIRNQVILHYSDPLIGIIKLGYLGSPQYFDPICPVNDLAMVEYNSSILILALCDDGVIQNIQADISFGSVVFSSINTTTNSNLSTIKCFSQLRECIIGNNQGQLMIYNYQSRTLVTSANLTLAILDLQYVQQHISNTTLFKIYVGLSSGIFVEYLYSNNILKFQRKSKLFEGFVIESVINNFGGDYIYISGSSGYLTQYQISSGLVIHHQNFSSNFLNQSQLSFGVHRVSQDKVIIFNPSNPQPIWVQATEVTVFGESVDGITRHLYCLQLNFYNTTIQLCDECAKDCIACYPRDGTCAKCQEGYFAKDMSCQSCFYSSQAFQGNVEECFSQIDGYAIESSKLMAIYLPKILKGFNVLLGMTALVFIFLKLINFWAIISMYYFLPIQLPFYLLNLLKLIFEGMNNSVFKTLGVPISLTLKSDFDHNQLRINQIQISFDFLEYNFQNICLFLYSVLLIVTVYKIIHFLCKKCSIIIFQEKSFDAIFDEFVGNFSVSMIPFYLLFRKFRIYQFSQKVNYFLYLVLSSIIFMAPFIYFAFTQDNKKNKKISSNKIYVGDQALAEKERKEKAKFMKKIEAWNNEQRRDKFLYSLLTFSISFLITVKNPIFFFILIGLINLLSLINGCYSKIWTINNIIQKFVLLSYHCCFVSLYYVDAPQKLQISSLALFIILFGGVHQLVTTISKKIFFLYMIIKEKLQEKERLRKMMEEAEQDQFQRSHPFEFEAQEKENSMISIQKIIELKSNKTLVKIDFVEYSEDKDMNPLTNWIMPELKKSKQKLQIEVFE